MATLSPPVTRRLQASNWLVQYILPVGWIAMLTGMFWIGDRSLYHKLYYGLVAVPTVAALALRPRMLITLIRNPIFLAFIAFSSYMMLTLIWSSSDNYFGSLIKRPLYIGLLLLAAGLIAFSSLPRFAGITRVSALIAVASAAILLLNFGMVELPRGVTRLSGTGALYNPLLTSHVLGAFGAYWMATAFHSPKGKMAWPICCLGILLVAILATGSRTPLVGLLLGFIWLVVSGHSRRGLIGMALILAGGFVLVSLYPDVVMQRGLSYRPQIWAEVLKMVAERPWFGHGYDAHMTLNIAGLHEVLSDPHNIELGVLHEGGIVGLFLWSLLYTVALTFCWRFRNEPIVNVAGAWLVFGFGAGLTEGAAFLSRPKEHWLLIWLPMAFVYGLQVKHSMRASTACHCSQELGGGVVHRE